MTKYFMSREFYIPEGAVLMDAQGTDAAVYVYELAGAPYSVAFHGTAAKPDYNYRHKSVEQRTDFIARFIAARKSHAEYIAKKRQERKAPHTLKLGAILSSSWGYDQTNVDFYEVVAVVGNNSVKIQKIGQALAEEQKGGPSAEYVVPVPGSYKGEPMLKRVSAGNYIRLNSYSGASVWSGNPKYQTAWGWGH